MSAEEIDAYLAALPEPKRGTPEQLRRLVEVKLAIAFPA